MNADRLYLRLLTEEALDRIEETARRLLDEVGIALEHEEARELLQDLGCRAVGERVHIPPGVVDWAMKNVTPARECRLRDGSPAYTLGDGQVRFHNGGGQPDVLDLDTGARRRATLQDVADVTRLLDALPNVDQITPLFSPQDVPPDLLFVSATAAMLRNTAKPMSAAAVDRPDDVPYLVEMAAACYGGPEAFRQRPNMSISVSPVSPLKFPPPIAGAILAIVRSGAPVVYCSRISPIDLRSAISVWGGPEVGMSGACASQLAHRLGMPCDSYGLSTTSPGLDPQFAYERLANALVPAMAGVDILSGVGMGGGIVGGFEIAVIDDEVISLIKHVVAGCEVSEATLAYDLMEEVIPRDGIFLGERHTVRQMRRGALWIPGLSVRDPASAEDVVDRARARAREILAGHEAEPLPEAVDQHLEEILERAGRELVAG
ncbi:MAG: trimethylamine methyltransferase family protein [Anaerolineae bacterium]|jgi:trimethylamine--corrinoid protein Co-methyltransferase